MGRVSCNLADLTYLVREVVSSPVGRVSCNTVMQGLSDKAVSFVPCGACELQSFSLQMISDSISSSPVGRVSCNLKKNFINLKNLVSSPVGRVSCNFQDITTELTSTRFRPLWGV